MHSQNEFWVRCCSKAGAGEISPQVVLVVFIRTSKSAEPPSHSLTRGFVVNRRLLCIRGSILDQSTALCLI